MLFLKRILLFIFICLSGLFTAWIGGVEPFTTDAGFISFCTLFLGCTISIGVLE